MRQHLSVLLFFVRNSFYKILLVLFGLAAVESALFFWNWKLCKVQYEAGEVSMLAAEVVLGEIPMHKIFMASVILVGLLLCRTGRRKGGRQEYTLHRLQISPRSVFVWQAVYNCGCFFLLWAVQAAVAAGLCLYFVRTEEPFFITNQSLFLAFYRDSFLHGLIPLADVFCWIRNVLLFLMLGLLAADLVYCERTGKKHGWLMLYFASINLSMFPETLWHSNAGFGAVFCLITIGIMGYWIFAKGVWKLDESGRKA